MPGKKEDKACPCCKRGNLIKKDREIAYSQWTDKGFVLCRVTVRLASASDVAPRASAIRSNPFAEDAVHREYKSWREPRCRPRIRTIPSHCR